MLRALPAVALVGAGCGLVPSADEAASLPPAPPVVEGVPDPVPPPAPDGLHRFIVRPPVPIVDAPTPATGSNGVEDAGGDMGADAENAGGDTAAGGDGSPTDQPVDAAAPPPDPAWTLDQSLIDRLDDDTVVVFVDSVPGFHDDTGRFIALVGSSSASSGRPIVRMDDPLTEQDVIDELLAVDGVVSAVPIGDGTLAVVAEEADTLEGLGFEAVVDPPIALAMDPYEPYQWTLDNTGDNLASLDNPPVQVVDADIDGMEAKAGPRGDGVVVAVIDTGVDFSHPDLAGQDWVNDDEVCNNLVDDDGNGFVDDCNGWDFGDEDNQPWSAGQNNHGTHVAGTIAARADNGVGVVGMAPEVEIMDLNVDGAGGMTLSGIARAVRYAADNGAHVINMSLGTQPGTPSWAAKGLIDAVAHAEASGVLVVVAAGNANVSLDAQPVWPANIEAANMITVGASAPDDTRASFSNYGSPVDLFAPGVLILSTVPGGYSFMNGTSMASPTAAGAAAAVLSANPDLDPQEVRTQLVGTADRPPAYAGLAANPVRINQAWALGIEGDPTQVEVSVTGLTQATADGVIADLAMSEPGSLADEPYRWEATLVAIRDGQPYGLVEHPVLVDWQSDETDETGAILLAEGTDDRARLETTLPPGDYAMVVEAVPEDDPTVRLGEAHVTTFNVPEAPVEEPTTTTTTPGSTSTTTPASTTPDEPTTTTPSPTVPPTTRTTPTSSPGTPSPTSPGPTTTQGSTTSASTAPTTTPPPGQTTAPTTPPTTGPTTSPTTVAPTSAPTTSPPGGGGATTNPTVPTTAPATTVTTQPAPTTGAPTSAGPTTTQAPAPTTTTVAPTTTSGAPPTTTISGDFAVHSITPTSGWMDQQTMVSIDGVFPGLVFVWFGDQPGDLIYQSSNWIIAVAPSRSQAGPVDVSLRSPSAGTVLLVTDGFTYLDPGGSQAPTTPTTSPATTTTSPGGGGTSPTTSPGSGSTTTSPGATTTSPGATSPTTSPGGTSPTTGSTTSSPTIAPTTSPTTSSPTTSSPTTGPTPSTTEAPGASTTVESTTTTAAPTGPPRTARSRVVGGAVGLSGGLTGVPLAGLGGLGDVPVCVSEPCRARRI
ncbi:MAG: S8 family serine peptidase [Actinomycetota bacterium]